jgi:DNA-binding PadR family transcriptional regulator
MSAKPLGEFERMVMLAVLRLAEQAHGVRICRQLERATRRSVSRGAVYKTLDRLEKKGYVTWQVEESTPERRRLPRRRFALTAEGLDAVRASQRVFDELSQGLEDVLERG